MVPARRGAVRRRARREEARARTVEGSEKDCAPEAGEDPDEIGLRDFVERSRFGLASRRRRRRARLVELFVRDLGVRGRGPIDEEGCELAAPGRWHGWLWWTRGALSSLDTVETRRLYRARRSCSRRGGV